MLFSELVLQGVRNFSQTHRFPLGNGFTAFVGGAGAGKSTFVDVLVHILFPDTSELATEAFKSTASEICRAALTVDSGDGQIHRLVKDLLRGSSALTRLDPASSKFVTISSAAAEILQYMSSTLHLPQRDVFEGIYVTRLGDLPSVAPAAGPAGGGLGMDDAQGVGAPPGALGGGAPPGALASGKGPSPSRGLPPSSHFEGGGGFQGYQGDEFDDQGEVLPDDPAEIQEQIAVLERDLGSARMVDDLQFELDGLQSQMFELEDKVREVNKLQKWVDELKERLTKYAMLDGLPGDFEMRVREFEKTKERFARDRQRLLEDKVRWQKVSEEAVPKPLTKNRNFLLGIGGGLVALMAGVAGFYGYEPLRYLALADLAFFAVAMVAWIRHLDQVMGVERSKVRLEAVEEREQKLLRQYELESSMVRRTMEQTGAETTGQILELFAKHREATQDISKNEAELKKMKAAVGADAIEAQRAELQQKIQGVDGQLAQLSGMIMSVNDMENKLQLLRDKLRWTQDRESGQSGGMGSGGLQMGGGGLGMGAPPGALLGGNSASLASASAPPAGEANGPDPSQRLVKLAEDLFLIDAEKINANLSQRLSQFAAALTANAVTQVTMDVRGQVEVFSSADGGLRPIAELPPQTRDLVFLAMKFAFIEAASKRTAVPVFLDDPFKNLPLNLHEIICRMLAAVGRTTQVILFTSQAGLTQHATASYSL